LLGQSLVCLVAWFVLLFGFVFVRVVTDRNTIYSNKDSTKSDFDKAENTNQGFWQFYKKWQEGGDPYFVNYNITV
jgi:hypothetical protein